jgi:hypothetical protein
VGKSGWTVVLVTTPDKGQAETQARNAAKQSISAGVLSGSEYDGFEKGTWIAFMGQYDTKSAAKRASESYKAKGFSGTPTAIKPKTPTKK